MTGRRITLACLLNQTRTCLPTARRLSGQRRSSCVLPVGLVLPPARRLSGPRPEAGTGAPAIMLPTARQLSGPRPIPEVYR